MDHATPPADAVLELVLAGFALHDFGLYEIDIDDRQLELVHKQLTGELVAEAASDPGALIELFEDVVVALLVEYVVLSRDPVHAVDVLLASPRRGWVMSEQRSRVVRERLLAKLTTAWS